MSALFDDAAVIHDKYKIGVAYRRQAVSYNEAGPALHQLCERVLDLQLGTRINGRGRLVGRQSIMRDMHRSCFCPCERLPPSSPITVS